MEEKQLTEQQRVNLDNIVSRMINNKETDADIQFVVNDYKQKYGSPKLNYGQRVIGGLTEIKKDVESEVIKQMKPLTEFAQQPSLEKLPGAISAGGLTGLGRAGLRIAGGLTRAAFTPIVEAPGIKQATEFVVGKALEIPAVKELTETVSNLAIKYPTAAKDARDIFDIVTTFYIPTAGKLATQEAKLIGKDISQATKLALTPSEESVQKGIIETFNKSVKPTAKKTIAAGEKYENDVLTALKTIKSNADKLNIEDSAGELISRTPETLNELAQSIEQTKGIVFNQYNDLAKAAGKMGAEINVTPVVNELKQVAQNRALRITNPELIKFAESWIERLGEFGTIDTETMQEIIKNLNTSLNVFYRNPTYDAAKKASIEAGIANQFRKLLDSTIENATGKEYQALKNQYGALKAIENDVVRASMRDARKNVKGLLDYTDILTGGQMVSGIISLNPAMFTKGAIERGFKEWIKFLNDPNRAVKNIFDKLSIDTDVKFTPQSELGKYIQNPKLGLSIQDISKSSSDANQYKAILEKQQTKSFPNSIIKAPESKGAVISDAEILRGTKGMTKEINTSQLTDIWNKANKK